MTANGTKDLLFLLSNSGKLMAIDAQTGSQVWIKATTGHSPTTASPAIDPNGLYVYSYGVDGNAHKYQIGDGTEITGSGWPATITLKTDSEKGASGFTIAQSSGINYLVVVTDGYIGDGGDYQGHLVSISLADGSQKTFNVMCSDITAHLVKDGTPGTDDCNFLDDPPINRRGQQGGIWGRGGATFDESTSRLYIATGNADFTAGSGGHDWGDSVLALSVDGSGAGGGMPLDSYTPTNHQSLYTSDTDLGSISMAVLPVPAGSVVTHLGMQVGKDAKLRLIDLDDMSGQGAPTHTGGELQLLGVPQGGGGMREQPAVWVNPADQSTWLFVANSSGLSALQLGLNGNNIPQLTMRWSKTGSSNSATSPVVANGVLFSACNTGSSSCKITARNPLTGDVLWTSSSFGKVHWQSPIVVDGAIYITDNNSKLWKFALPFTDTIFANGFDD